MTKFRKVFVAMVALAALTVGTQARAGSNPYSDCGIGAALFPETHWAAVISNVIWDLGTTALTSATASPDTCSGSNAAAAAFIYETYDNLAEETAKGEGEHLTTLLNILDSADGTRAEVIASVRAGMAANITAADYDKKTRVEKSKMYYDLVMSAI